MLTKLTDPSPLTKTKPLHLHRATLGMHYCRSFISLPYYFLFNNHLILSFLLPFWSVIGALTWSSKIFTVSDLNPTRPTMSPEVIYDLVGAMLCYFLTQPVGTHKNILLSWAEPIWPAGHPAGLKGWVDHHRAGGSSGLAQYVDGGMAGEHEGVQVCRIKYWWTCANVMRGKVLRCSKAIRSRITVLKTIRHI